MLGAQSRHFAHACLMVPFSAIAQDGGGAQPPFPQNVGQLYEESQQDVTLPLAYGGLETDVSEAAVSIPLENFVTPMSCMTAWSYLAGRAILAPDVLRRLHPDFTEATASAHWQHWLNVDLVENQGVLSADFHQRRLAAERAFSVALAQGEEAYAFQTLGACYVEPARRTVGDPTKLLRNFMIEHQGLPETYAVPGLQRQLRAFPVSVNDEVESDEGCAGVDQATQLDASDRAKLQCFDRGGILVSKTKVSLETAEGACRITAIVQCENIP